MSEAAGSQPDLDLSNDDAVVDRCARLAMAYPVGVRNSVARAHVFGVLGLARRHPVQRTKRSKDLADRAVARVAELEKEATS